MTRFASIAGAASFTAGPRLAGLALMDPDPPTGLDGEATFSAGIAGALFPARAGRRQVCGLEVTVGGSTLDPGLVLDEWRVTISLDALDSWEIAVPHVADLPTLVESPLGNPVLIGAPPPGLAAVDIDGVYLASDGVHRVRLVTNGVAAAFTRSGGLDRISGLSAGGRHDGRLASLALPPGHGLRRGEVVRRLAVAAGVSTPTALEPGARMAKEVQVTESPWLEAARELMRVEGRALTWDEAGALVNPAVRSRALAERRVVITDRDVLDESVSLSGDNSGPTRITLVGTRQLEREDCGRRTVERIIETFGTTYPLSAAFVQNAAGVLTSIAVTPPPLTSGLLIQSRVVVREEWECDTLISTVTETYGWFWPLSWRYQVDADGVIDTYANNVYIEEPGAVADDSSHARAWPAQRFTLIRRDTEIHEYDGRGFNTRSTLTAEGWKYVRAAVKVQSGTPVAWQTRPFETDVNLLASGEGIVGTQEYFLGNGPTGFDPGGVFVPGSGRRLERSTTDRDVTDDGFLLSETTATESVFVRKGNAALYQGGEEGAEDQESFQDDGLSIATYQEVDTGAHRIITIDVDRDGAVTLQTEDAEGYLPTVERQEDIEPDPDLFGEGAAASRAEAQSIECELSSPALESARPRRDLSTSDPWIEDEDECRSLISAMLSELNAISGELQMPVIFSLRPPESLSLRLRCAGLAADAELVEVTHEATSAGVVSKLRCEIYVV